MQSKRSEYPIVDGDKNHVLREKERDATEEGILILEAREELKLKNTIREAVDLVRLMIRRGAAEEVFNLLVPGLSPENIEELKCATEKERRMLKALLCKIGDARINLDLIQVALDRYDVENIDQEGVEEGGNSTEKSLLEEDLAGGISEYSTLSLEDFGRQ